MVIATERATLRAYWILALAGVTLFLFYADRQALTYLKTTVSSDFGFSARDYSILVAAFMIPYTAMFVVSGRLVDRWGVRFATSVAVALMSLAGVAAGIAQGLLSLGAARLLLGGAEAFVLPAITIALVRWFPVRQHGMAFGVRSTMQALGAIGLPCAVARFTLRFGWRSVFIVPGVAGLLVAVLWWISGPEPGGRQASAPGAESLSLRQVFQHPLLRRIILARIVSDPFWFFFNHWHIGFLQERLGMSLADTGRWTWIPPAFQAIGMLLLGVWSDRMIRNADAPIDARFRFLRRIAFLAPAAAALPFVNSASVVIGLFALIYLMCDGWLTYTTVALAEAAPSNSVASLIAIVSLFSGTSSILFNLAAGPLIDAFGYGPCLLIGAALYPLGATLLRTNRAAS